MIFANTHDRKLMDIGMFKSQGIVITGSSGLIGSRLTKCLGKKGINVYPIDQQLSAEHPGSGDIRNSLWLKKQLIACKGIVHLAAVSRVVWGEKEPELCWETNVEATQTLLEIAHSLPSPPWFIYASSREVYGQQTQLPVSEDALLQPLNIYAKSKVAAEALTNAYRQKGLQTAILRFSSVYGSANDYPDRVIPAFCLNALHNKPLRVEGLNNTFDFTHVEDVVRGIIQVISLLENKENYLPPIHLTTGKSTTLLELIETIQQIRNKKIDYYEAPQRQYDVHSFYGNPSRAKKYLNWAAEINLIEGLKDLIQQHQISLTSGIAL